MPAVKFEIEVVVPVPVMFPGFIVQVPVEGKPLISMVPVALLQSGCEFTLVKGADGVEGEAVITTLTDADEIHPSELVTV